MNDIEVAEFLKSLETDCRTDEDCDKYIKSFDGKAVHRFESRLLIFIRMDEEDDVRGEDEVVAEFRLIKEDMSLTPFFIARRNNLFSYCFSKYGALGGLAREIYEDDPDAFWSR